MKRVCCSSLFRALVEGRLEWTPVSEGGAVGALAVGIYVRWYISRAFRSDIGRAGFVPLLYCPYCGEEV